MPVESTRPTEIRPRQGCVESFQNAFCLARFPRVTAVAAESVPLNMKMLCSTASTGRNLKPGPFVEAEQGATETKSPSQQARMLHSIFGCEPWA